MRSDAVRVLQTRLLRNKLWVDKVDGVYGHTTTQAVMALQKATGLSRDGVAGPQTLNALRRGVRLAPAVPPVTCWRSTSAASCCWWPTPGA